MFCFSPAFPPIAVEIGFYGMQRTNQASRVRCLAHLFLIVRIIVFAYYSYVLSTDKYLIVIVISAEDHCLQFNPEMYVLIGLSLWSLLRMFISGAAWAAEENQNL